MHIYTPQMSILMIVAVSIDLKWKMQLLPKKQNITWIKLNK